MSSAPPPFLQSHPSPFNSAAVSTSEPQSVSPFFIVAVIVGVFAVVLCACFRLRYPLFIHSLSSSPSATSPSPPMPTDLDPTTVIQSLPLFSLSSLASPSLNKLVGSDCAVCLSRFQTFDELRLLPSCRHAFHSKCIDLWLHQNLTCPLCRKSVYQVSPSESFKIEIGNVGCRSTASATDAVRSRSYSFGSFEYVVEGEIDAVVFGIQTREIHNVGPIGLGDDVAAGGIRGASSLASSPQSNDNNSPRNSINNDINVGPIGSGDDVAANATGGTSSWLQDCSGSLTSLR